MLSVTLAGAVAVIRIGENSSEEGSVSIAVQSPGGAGLVIWYGPLKSARAEAAMKPSEPTAAAAATAGSAKLAGGR